MDVTQDPELAYWVNQKYEIQQGSFIYKQRCGNINGTFHGWKECNVVQVAGGCLPKTFDEYKNYLVTSKESLRRCLRHPDGKDAEILDYVPAGTSITIDKIVKYPLGFEVICWVIQGKVRTSKFSEYEVQLPSCSYHEPPAWFFPTALHLPGLPQPKPEFLKPEA